MIEVVSLHKKFGTVVAVEDVSFRAGDGKVTGLLGPNGAGKTTSLRLLYGLLTPDRGEARVDGIRVATDVMAARARLGILPDARGLYQRLTAREHLLYFGRLHGVPEATLRERITETSRLLDLQALLDRRVAGFSQGERVKVALARSLMHAPRNVILDEPTNGLDVMSTRAVRSLVQELKRQGCCVVFSSHIMQEVAALCDEVVVIARGRVIMHGSPAELREKTGQTSLEDAFVAAIGDERGVS